MNKTALRLVAALLLFALSGAASAAICNSLGTGNWNAGGTWSCGATPGAADDVTINNGHNVNLNGTNRNSRNLTIVTGGTLTTGSAGLTINNNGAVQINGLLQGNGNAASLLTKTGTGALSGTGTINNLTTFVIAGATAAANTTNLTFTGANCRLDVNAGVAFTNNGTLTFNSASCATANGMAIWSGAGTAFNNASATSVLTTGTIFFVGTGTFTNAGTVTAAAVALNNPSTFTNNGTATVTGDITGSNAAGSVWTQGANSTVNVAGAMLATGTLNASANPNTVNYSGAAAQTTKLPSAGDYHHLTVTNGGTTTLSAGPIDIAGNFTIGAGAIVTAATNNPVINLTGDFNNGGTFTTGTGQFTLQGTVGTQTITGATTIASLRINNTGSGVTLNNNVTVSTTLTLTAGIVTTGANRMIVSSTGATPVSGGSATSYIVGCMQKNFAAGGTLNFRATAGQDEFPVGIAGAYVPIEITAGTTTTAGNLVVCVNSGDHPQMTVANGGGIDTTKSVNRYWSMTSTTLNTSALANRMNAIFKFPGGATEYDGGATTGSFIVERWDGVDWNPTTLVAALATSTQAQTIDLTAGTDDFAIGQALAGFNANPGAFNVFETTTPAGAVLGRIFTKRAGVNFTLSIVAVLNNGVNAAPSTNALTIEVVDSTTNSGVFSAATNCWSGWVPVTGSAATTVPAAVGWAAGRISVPITAPARAARNARIRVTQAGTGAIGCSTDNFSLRPSSLTVTSTNATNNNTTGAPAIKAGANFNLTATAIAGYDGTPGVDNSVGMVIGTATQGSIGGSFGAAPVATGVATGSTFTYSEVGNFGLNLNAIYDSSFTSVDPSNDCTADFSNALVGGKYGCSFGSTAVAQTTGVSGFGRFIPDHFFVAAGSTLTNRSAAACGPASTFSYMGEGMGFAFTLQARNSAGTVTQNYAGAYAKLNPATIAQLGFGAVNGATNLTSRLDLSVGSAGSFASGQAAVTATVAVTRPSPDNPDGPFGTAKIGIAPSDSDGVTARAADMNMDVDAAGGNDHVQVGANTEIRFGRLRMENAVGSEALTLAVPIQAQYWNGAGFATNALDNCTTLARSDIALDFNPPSNLTACETAVNAASVPAFTAGVGSLTLTAPGSGNNGSVLLTVNLASAGGSYCNPGAFVAATNSGRSYLLGRWNDAVDTDANANTMHDDKPSARAAFGLYGSQPSNFIYFRENY